MHTRDDTPSSNRPSSAGDTVIARDDKFHNIEQHVDEESLSAQHVPRIRSRNSWRSLACIAAISSAVAVMTTTVALKLSGASGIPWKRPQEDIKAHSTGNESIKLLSSAGLTPLERAHIRKRVYPHEKFLIVMNVAEGMSSWYHALLEMMVLAKRLDRTLVEPCVRDGRIVSCVPGKVVLVPYGIRELDGMELTPAGAFNDDLALPTLGDACDRTVYLPSAAMDATARDEAAATRGGSDHGEGVYRADFSAPLEDGAAYPLRAYLNMSALYALYDRWLPFDDWWALESSRSPNEAEVTRRGATRLRAPLAYCAGKTGLADELDPVCSHPSGPFRIAPFTFDRIFSTWAPGGSGGDSDSDYRNENGDVSHGHSRRQMRRQRQRRTTAFGRVANAADHGAIVRSVVRPETQHLRAAVRMLRDDPRRNMFFFNVWRGGVAPVDTFTAIPPFNPVHYSAVDRWVRRTMAESDEQARPDGPVPRYVAFQWRSETVPDSKLRECAASLASVARSVVDGVAAVEHAATIATAAKLYLFRSHNDAASSGVLLDTGPHGEGTDFVNMNESARGIEGARAGVDGAALARGNLRSIEGAPDGVSDGRVSSSAAMKLTRGDRGMVIADAAAAAVAATTVTTSRPHGVLLSDMPAPNNRCKMWPVYEASMRRENRAAMRDMLRLSGLVKYDASHARLDAGVLAIRDFIIGAQAEWLVTCRGKGPKDCRECFRANSYFTKKLLDARRAAGRPSFTQWLSVTAQDLTEVSSGLPVRALAGSDGETPSLSRDGLNIHPRSDDERSSRLREHNDDSSRFSPQGRERSAGGDRRHSQWGDPEGFR